MCARTHACMLLCSCTSACLNGHCRVACLERGCVLQESEEEEESSDEEAAAKPATEAGKKRKVFEAWNSFHLHNSSYSDAIWNAAVALACVHTWCTV